MRFFRWSWTSIAALVKFEIVRGYFSPSCLALDAQSSPKKLQFVPLLGIVIFLLLTSCSSENKQKNELKSDTSSNISQENKTGLITGKVLYLGQPMEKAYALLNTDEDLSGKSMPVHTSNPSDQKGLFSFTVPPGKYYLSCKKRLSDSLFGPLLIGDYFCVYDKNPIEVTVNKKIDIGEIELKLVTSYGEDFINSPKNTGIKGNIKMLDNELLKDVFIYVYPDDNTNLRGPSFLISSPVKDDGKFKIDLSPGEYYIAARKRSTGQKTGILGLGDYNVVYQNNPAKVVLNQYTNLDTLTLKKVKSKNYETNFQKGFSKNKDTGIEGIIIDENNKPLIGLYAFIYREAQVVGKPLYISKETGADGKFAIYLKPGTYYLGARSRYNGPIEIDELVGSYEGNPDHLIKVEQGQIIKDVKIMAKKWNIPDE